MYPFLLVSLRLPPYGRVKHREIILYGIIPGEKGPNGLISSPVPDPRDKELEVRVSVWNGFGKYKFIIVDIYHSLETL